MSKRLKLTQIEGENSLEYKKLARKKSCNFQLKKINVSVEISCTVEEEYMLRLETYLSEVTVNSMR